MSQSLENKSRLIFAYITLYLMLIGGALLTYFAMVLDTWFYIGGSELVLQIWNGAEDKTQNASSVLLPLIFLAVPIGGKQVFGFGGILREKLSWLAMRQSRS
jgi:hypothetical protein